jgi:predicted NBD/HSP70 family sugar kinase
MKKTLQVLVIDVGGNNVKLLASGQKERRKFRSGPKLTPRTMVEEVKKVTADWKYEVITLGYPGRVRLGRIVREPKNLAKGWVNFNFAKAFGCPVQIINDAAMQALGSYRGGRMLFLGLGTGLGSALIVDGVLEPMELAHLPYRKGKTFEDYVGQRAIDRLGKKRWRKHVFTVVGLLKDALEPEYVVLGGGNIEYLKQFPPDAHPGKNENAFEGGFRMWQITKQGTHKPTKEFIFH